MKGFYKILISIFVFVSFIYPLKDFKGLDTDMFNDYSLGQYEDKRITVYENEVNAKIKELLEENGVFGADVFCRLSFYDETSLSIEEVQISIPDEYKKTEVQKIVFDGLGIDARVIYVGE